MVKIQYYLVIACVLFATSVLADVPSKNMMVELSARVYASKVSLTWVPDANATGYKISRNSLDENGRTAVRRDVPESPQMKTIVKPK